MANSEFKKQLREQADFVDREILVQQLMIAYDKNSINLETFISSDVRSALNYNTKYIWEFCGELSEAVAYGIKINDKTRYLRLKPNGIFEVLDFSSKKQRNSVLEVIEWSSSINFKNI